MSMAPAMRGAAIPMAEGWGSAPGVAVALFVAVAPSASVTVRVTVKVPAAV